MYISVLSFLCLRCYTNRNNEHCPDFLVALQILTLTAMPDILSKTSEVSLAIAFFTTLLNLLYLEPKSTRVMFDR